MTTEFIPVLSGLVLLFLPRLATRKRRIISAILIGAAASALAGELSGTIANGMKAIVLDAGIVYCVAATRTWVCSIGVSSRSMERTHSLHRRVIGLLGS